MLSIRNSYINKIINTILILIDKLTKYIIYIATIKDLKVDKLVDII